MLLGLKIAGAIVAVAALAGGVHWCAATIKKAGERDDAVAAVARAELEKVELAQTFATAQARNLEIAAELAKLREQRELDRKEFAALIAKRPLTKEVPIVVDGKQTTIRVRDAHRYRCLHNRAITGSADPDCVL